MASSLLDEPMTRGERLGLAFLVVFFLAFGVVTQVRSAMLSRRFGDLTVFLRAAWAVRTGHDLYAITDGNGWHYHYPPLFAILMTPLADPPPHQHAAGMLPYPVSVGIWFALNVAFLALAVHMLARAVEATSDRPAVPGSRWWWALRVLPVAACLPPITHTLVRGQSNLLLLLLIAGMAASLVRGRSWRAGIWLAGAICLKVIPALLLLYPLWRRDGRCLAGCAGGLVIGLVAVPAAVFGPQRALEYYQTMKREVLDPGIGQGPAGSRANELTNLTATHSQSFLAVIHRTLHPVKKHRPHLADETTRWLHRCLAALAVGLTLLAAGRRAGTGTQELLFLAALTVLMILVSPVCHTHYFCLAVPLVLALVAAARESICAPALPPLPQALLGFAYPAALAVPLLPALYLFRDFGLPLYATLGLWAAALFYLWMLADGDRQLDMARLSPR